MLIVFPALTSTDSELCTIFTIADDDLVEDEERFTVTGSGGSFVGGEVSIQVTIADNDGNFSS